jgi:hypothetical protein
VQLLEDLWTIEDNKEKDLTRPKHLVRPVVTACRGKSAAYTWPPSEQLFCPFLGAQGDNTCSLCAPYMPR